MAIPSGSGTEVLRTAAVNDNNAATALIDVGGTTGSGTLRTSGNTSGVVTVPADVIITILNMTCSSNAATHDIKVKIYRASTTIWIFHQLGLAINTTFVYSDKIVLREGDQLGVYNSANSCDWSVNFIYQDWT